MNSVEARFNYLDNIQSSVSMKLDYLDQISRNLNLSPSKKIQNQKPHPEEQQFQQSQIIDSSITYQQSKNPQNRHDILYQTEQFENQKLQNEIDVAMTKVNDNIITTNYINFYNFVLSRQNLERSQNLQKRKQMENQLSLQEQKRLNAKHKSTQVDFRRSRDKGNQMLLSLSLPHNVLQSNMKNDVSQKTKDLMKKKQQTFLTNELTNIKLKLNRLQNENAKLNSLLNSQKQVKSYKFLDKVINNFVEQLSLHWCDIVELLIDDLIEQEVYELNQIEMDKMNYNEIRLTTFADILKDAPKQQMKYELMFDSLYEIEDMINKVKQSEEEISKKYNIQFN